MGIGAQGNQSSSVSNQMSKDVARTLFKESVSKSEIISSANPLEKDTTGVKVESAGMSSFLLLN